MAETRFYLLRTVTDETMQNEPTKLKYNKYSANYDNVHEESPTFYSDEQVAKDVAQALNTIYKANDFKAYVDVFKEDVEVKQITFNDPQHAKATEHVVDVETEVATDKDVDNNVRINDADNNVETE